MNSGTLIAEAWISLGKNKVRTSLSMLGIIIGVGAVITLVAMAQATKQRIEDEIARMGDDWMFIRNFSMEASGVQRADVEGKPMQTKHDADAINAQCRTVRAASPSNRMTMQVRSSFANYAANVQGVYPNYHDIRRWGVITGRKLEDMDEIAKRPVCVIGQTAARELFGSMNPVGEEISVRNGRFKIVGLLEAKGRSEQRDNDDIILFPFSTFERRIAGAELSQTLIAAAAHGVDPKVAEDDIRRLLRERHNLRPGEPDDFRIFALAESAQVKEESSESFAWLLGMIAGVSLVVGGIGIMNIMLVSVTERTREIGLRMAIGASNIDIMMQFLIEAVVLCTLGGILGMFCGWGFSHLLTSWKGYETAVSYWIAGIALGFAFATGVFFGFYPAWRASRMDPIEALRYE
ncbi:MAG: multidrug ABC transporter substrate-binding protein [Planctomycetota bacterium]|nr:MAG: multidrug ABC transporter substrate-binding protein [Planctomycetota bacterium]